MNEQTRIDETREAVSYLAIAAKLLTGVGAHYAATMALAASQTAEQTIPAAPAANDPDQLLREIREDVRDWQDALSGERDGLDDLCARIDSYLGNPPKPLPWNYVQPAGIDRTPVTAQFDRDGLTLADFIAFACSAIATQPQAASARIRLRQDFGEDHVLRAWTWNEPDGGIAVLVGLE